MYPKFEVTFKCDICNIHWKRWFFNEATMDNWIKNLKTLHSNDGYIEVTRIQ